MLAVSYFYLHLHSKCRVLCPFVTTMIEYSWLPLASQSDSLLGADYKIEGRYLHEPNAISEVGSHITLSVSAIDEKRCYYTAKILVKDVEY